MTLDTAEVRAPAPPELSPDVLNATQQTHGAFGRLMRRIVQHAAFWYALAIVLLVAVWQLVVTLSSTPSYLLPPPRRVGSALIHYRSVLLKQTGVTVREVLIAFAVSVAVGIAIAVPIAFVPAVRRLAYPVLVMSQAIPKIALGPLFIVWFGFGLETNILIAASVAVFPVIVNTAQGLSGIDPDLVRLGRSMGASRWRLLWYIRVPTALPAVLAGLRIAITLAVIGAVVGEFIAGGSGLGYLTISASGNQNIPLLFAAVICLSVVGILAYAAIEILEKALLRWHPSIREH